VHGAVFVVKDKDCSNRFASLCGGLYGVCWFVEVVCVVHGALFVLKDKNCSIGFASLWVCRGRLYCARGSIRCKR